MQRSQMRSAVSDGEMERRWSAIRAAMDTSGLDALVMQATNDWLGGTVRWFTDVPATNGYPRTVIFYRDRPMSVVEMGAFGAARSLGGSDPIHRGVGRMRHTPSFSSIGYTNSYDAALVVDELSHSGVRAIGLITPLAMPHALVAGLRDGLPDMVFSDATELVDGIKAIKSADEIALIRQTATLQDAVLAEVLDVIRPGLTDIDIANHAQATAHRLGSDQGIFLGMSAALGQSARFAGRHFQGRELSPGDHFSLLIEVNGPGGMYLEIARTIVLGTATDALHAAFDAVCQAQTHTLSLIRPGAKPAEIAAAHDRYMTTRGLPPETRLYAHGQGSDMVERPLIRHDETMALAESMCLAVHPGYDDGTVFAVVCDNCLIEADGASACLHLTPKTIFERR